MAAQYELLKELLNSGTKLSFGQDFFFKFYQAFLLKDRWMQYISGVGNHRRAVDRAALADVLEPAVLQDKCLIKLEKEILSKA